MILDYSWNTLENWFLSGGLETRIIGLILAIVITILSIWFTFEILKLTFLLTIEILKATFMGLSIMFYTLIVVFITAPIGLISRGEDIATIVDNYLSNLKQIVHVFYPKLFKEETHKKIYHYHHQHHHQPRKYVVTRPKEMKTVRVNQPEYTSRSEELNSRTMIVSHPKTSSHNEVKFFCTDCGEEFTPKMKAMLTENKYTFCEHCGRKFNQVNNLPISA
ncbi:hypothetical protein DSAG12_01535 [Promethearchaeum syntrophicum]|uniref:Uncharacterized protein n=1 Tax=Promethearchaeum syntrophicum TaxID=2594042 RepID=A0A5B9D8W5_9ARCH|nr:hypothetical protein [Candidatus Prometheoarchaeum syntrophicum]QEE15708.1 hypothetical protein DSAG12_01535 [Candidatus Prometheoarchaeum syntrophicum]